MSRNGLIAWVGCIIAAQLGQVDRDASLQSRQDRDLRPGDKDLSDRT